MVPRSIGVEEDQRAVRRHVDELDPRLLEGELLRVLPAAGPIVTNRNAPQVRYVSTRGVGEFVSVGRQRCTSDAEARRQRLRLTERLPGSGNGLPPQIQSAAPIGNVVEVLSIGVPKRAPDFGAFGHGESRPVGETRHSKRVLGAIPTVGIEVGNDIAAGVPPEADRVAEFSFEWNWLAGTVLQRDEHNGSITALHEVG